MYTAISYDIPDPGDDFLNIFKTLKGDWGETFQIGSSRGRLNLGDWKRNPRGQVYYFTPVIVPHSRLQEFKARILELGGIIRSEEPADRILAEVILAYASKFPSSVVSDKLITHVLEDKSNNLQADAREYLENLINKLISENRLFKMPDEDALSVNPNEESWESYGIFRLHNQLLENIRQNQGEIEKLLTQVRSHRGHEDMLYRFYHNSFKVYRIQSLTGEIVKLLRSLDPRPGEQPLNEYFELILCEGTGKTWAREHNDDWLKNTRPMLEAFHHALMFLEHADEYGEALEEAPSAIPSGWGHLLYLFCLR